MAKTDSTRAARFTSRYTEAMKDALLHSVIIEGRTVKATILLAETGQLSVPAFKVGNYAYDIVRDGRESFEARNDEALTLAVADELKGAELDGLATIRAIRRTFKRDGTDDTTALARAARDLTLIRKARKDANTRPVAKPVAYTPEQEAANTAEQPNVVADLLAKTGQGAGTGSVKRAPIDAPSPRAA